MVAFTTYLIVSATYVSSNARVCKFMVDNNMQHMPIDFELIDHVAFGSGPIEPKMMKRMKMTTKVKEKVTWDSVSARAGRNDMPEILAQCILDEVLSPEELRKAVAETWVMCEWPARVMTVSTWVYIFDMALPEGMFLYDEGELKSTSEIEDTLTLYRGAWEGSQEGMSWTCNKKRASWFAHRFDGVTNDEGVRQVGKLYEVTIPSELVLARFDARNEEEVVIDCMMLFEDDIQEVRE